MAKRRRGHRKIDADPIQQVLTDLLGEVKSTVAQGLREILMPKKPPMFQETTHISMGESRQDPEVIKEAEVISVRKG